MVGSLDEGPCLLTLHDHPSPLALCTSAVCLQKEDVRSSPCHNGGYRVCINHSLHRTAGIQCSVKLATFAGQVKTASEQITSIAEDISLSASIWPFHRGKHPTLLSKESQRVLDNSHVIHRL